MIYKIIDSDRSSFCDYKIERDGEIIYDVKTHNAFSGQLDFLAINSNGDKYEMKTSGIFLWRKHHFYKNGEEIALYKPYKCISDGLNLKFSISDAVFFNGKKIFDIKYPMTGLVSGEWEYDDLNLEPYIVGLLLLTWVGTRGVY